MVLGVVAVDGFILFPCAIFTFNLLLGDYFRVIGRIAGEEGVTGRMLARQKDQGLYVVTPLRIYLLIEHIVTWGAFFLLFLRWGLVDSLLIEFGKRWLVDKIEVGALAAAHPLMTN